jgi:choline dehydrogenase-like flavoprotein
MIEQGREHRGERTLRAEVCVIGSGAGGAVVGALLAEGGRDVVVLEQGGYNTATDFDQREDTMFPLLFEDAGMRTTDNGEISVLQGRGVGGSTVHNLSYCFRAPDPILQLWEEEHGVRDLESLDASFDRVEAGLHVGPITEEEMNSLNRAMRRGADLLGYSGGVARHNRVGCVRSGFCLLGCAYDAKQSMLVTYIPRADRAGARIVSDCRADRIESGPGGRRHVRAVVLDALGQPRGELLVEASVVVVSAGAIASPLLLERSGLGLESGQLGRNLHLHPAVVASGIFPERMNAYYGIPQAYYIDEFIDLERDPHSGVILMPISGFPVMTATSLPGFGPELYGYLRELPYTGGVLALLHDRSSGQVTAGENGRPRIRYTLEPADRRQLVEGLKHSVEVLWAGGAERVLVPYWQDPVFLRPEDGLAEIDRRGLREGSLPMNSTHPQSTCRMGADPSNSVVDSFGELHDTSGVFVADMGVFPTSLGAPPQITTAALGDRTAHHILDRWSELGS